MKTLLVIFIVLFSNFASATNFCSQDQTERFQSQQSEFLTFEEDCQALRRRIRNNRCADAPRKRACVNRILARRDADNDCVRRRIDNCPETFNYTQEDTDADGVGDACDPVGATV